MSSRAHPALFALGLLAFAACSSKDGGGDLDNLEPHTTFKANPIAEMNDPAKQIYCEGKCPTGVPCQKQCPALSARGVVVVGVDNFDERGDGSAIGNIYVQDAVQTGPKGTAYSGLTLFRSQKVPSTLAVVVGMGVDVGGKYQPFPGPKNDFPPGVVLPEVDNGAISQAFEGYPPVPIEITLAELGTTKDYKPGMAYVGRLVTIKNVTLSSSFDPKYKEAAMDGTSSTSGSLINIASQLFDLQNPAGPAAKSGTKYKSVTGVLNYFYNFKLCPRTAADLEN